MQLKSIRTFIGDTVDLSYVCKLISTENTSKNLKRVTRCLDKKNFLLLIFAQNWSREYYDDFGLTGPPNNLHIYHITSSDNKHYFLVLSYNTAYSDEEAEKLEYFKEVKPLPFSWFNWLFRCREIIYWSKINYYNSKDLELLS